MSTRPSQPLGSLGLWTVNEPRDGPSAPSEDTFPLPQQRPSHPEMSEHHHPTETPAWADVFFTMGGMIGGSRSAMPPG